MKKIGIAGLFVGVASLLFHTLAWAASLPPFLPGTLFVADKKRDQIVMIDSGGEKYGTIKGIKDPIAMAIYDGQLYAADKYGTIRRATSDGGWETYASGFDDVEAIAFDAKGNLYVAGEREYKKKYKIYKDDDDDDDDKDKKDKDDKDKRVEEENIFKVTADGSTSAVISGGFKEDPVAMAVDPMNGNIYVANDEQNQIAIFTSDGEYIGSIKNYKDITDLAIDSVFGKLYVVDKKKGVNVYGLDGTFIESLGNKNTKALAIGDDGSLFVAGKKSIDLISSPGSLFASGFKSITALAYLGGGPGSAVPEPGTLLLIGSGLAGLGVGAWRRNRRK